MANFINTLNGLVWATPLIVLTFGGALLYTIILKFSNIKNVRLQWKLLKSGGGSQEGISPFETFCSVVAYRVAVGNIGGVMVAILYGGPGAVLWMPITALVTSAISYAENSLGQVYKVRMDGQYRGGPYFYMANGIKWKSLGKVMAVIFALFATIGVPFMVTGPSASNISMAFENSLGVAPIISGIVIAVLLFLVISGRHPPDRIRLHHYRPLHDDRLSAADDHHPGSAMPLLSPAPLPPSAPAPSTAAPCSAE